MPRVPLYSPGMLIRPFLMHEHGATKMKKVFAGRAITFGTTALLFSLVTGALSYNAIVKSAPQCISSNSATCNEYVFLLQVTIVAFFAGLALILLGLWKNLTRSKPRLGIALLGGSVLSSIVCAAFIIWTLLQYSAPPENMKTPKSSGDSQTSTADDPSDKRLINYYDAKSNKSSPKAIARHPFPEVPRTRQGLPLADDPFIATSIAEQKWLDRNGYPNAQQWRTLLQASDFQLRDAALAGDEAAKTLLDQRRLMSGDDTAIDNMMRDAATGSTFALELLSSTLAGPGGDQVMGYALSRVVEMRGNYRVAIARDFMLHHPLSQSEKMRAEKIAIEMYNSLRQLQIKLEGPNSTPVDPRPVGR